MLMMVLGSYRDLHVKARKGDVNTNYTNLD